MTDRVPDDRKTLLSLLAFNALTALGGAIGLISGALMPPKAWLDHSPFTSYVIPGLLLGMVVGGSAILAWYLAFQRSRHARIVTCISGVVLVCWILGEVAVIQTFSWLQVLYVIIGFDLIAHTFNEARRTIRAATYRRRLNTH